MYLCVRKRDKFKKTYYMTEKHLKHIDESVPFSCEDCENFIEGARCKAFEPIPIDFLAEAETHDKVVEGQRGDYVFTTQKKRRYNRVYIIG